MKPNNQNVKSILPLIMQPNHSRSPTNIQKDPKEKSDNNINNIHTNKFPNIKSVSNSQEIKKEEKDTNTYIEDMKKRFGRIGEGIKVVVDSANGTGGVVAPKLYRALGCEVIELYSLPDGRFPLSAFAYQVCR